MSTPSNTIISYSGSTHSVWCPYQYYNTSVIDQHSGDIVCSSCGVVMNERIAWDEVSPQINSRKTDGEKQRVEKTINDEEEKKTSSSHAESSIFEIVLRDRILDITSCLNLSDNSLLISSAYDIYVEVIKLHPKSMKSASASSSTLIRNLNNPLYKSILAFSIWEALNRQNISIKPHKIATQCDVLPGSMLKVEKIFNRSSTYCCYTTYVLNTCDRLGLNYKVTKPTTQLMEMLKTQYYGKDRTALLCACLLRVYDYKKLVNCNDLDIFSKTACDITWLSNYFEISIESIKNKIKLIPKFEINESNDICVFKKEKNK